MNKEQAKELANMFDPYEIVDIASEYTKVAIEGVNDMMSEQETTIDDYDPELQEFLKTQKTLYDFLVEDGTPALYSSLLETHFEKTELTKPQVELYLNFVKFMTAMESAETEEDFENIIEQSKLPKTFTQVMMKVFKTGNIVDEVKDSAIDQLIEFGMMTEENSSLN